MDKEGTTIMHFHAPIMHYYDHPHNVYVGTNKFDEAEEIKETEIPDILQTEEAKSILGNFIYNRLLTEALQPIDLSCTEQALLAKFICDRLNIIEVWQVFGNLWDIKPETLRTYFNRALEQRKSLKFQEKIKEMIG